MSRVAQIQLDRVRSKYQRQFSLVGPPPLMVKPTGPSYKSIVVRPLAWQPKPQFQPQIPAESKSELISRTIRALRARSTPQNPICLRCSSSGHLAHTCRNAQLCFICNKFGHTSRICRATASYFPPTPPHKPPDNPRLSRNARKPQRTRFAPMAAPLRSPIVTLLPTRESEQLEKEFAQSFILDDIGGWGPTRIEKTLAQKFKHTRNHRWIATIYTEWQYLIKAPLTAWLNSVAARGFLTLEDVEFPVLAWEPDFDDGLDLTPVWVRISGFPKTHWSWSEVEKVFNLLGAHILEIDPGTGGRYDWRFARIKLGVCDVRLIPPIHYVEYLNPSGKIRVYDLHIEIEHAKTESVHAWTARLNGRPYPNGTEFGLHPAEDEDEFPMHDTTDAVAQSENGQQIIEEVSNGAMDMGTATVSPVRGTPPSTCRLDSGKARKRDDSDDGAAGSGKRNLGLGGPKGSGSKGASGSGSNTGGSGSKGANGSGSKPKGNSGSKPSKRSLSPSRSLPLSTFSLLSTPIAQANVDSEDEPLLSIFSHLLHPKKPAEKKSTRGRSSPLSLKKKAVWAGASRLKSGIASRLRSSTPKTKPNERVIVLSDNSEPTSQLLITTPAVTDTATSSRQVATRQSLRVQMQDAPPSTMGRALKRIRDKAEGTCSSAGNMDKKLKAAAEEWLPKDLNVIPLRVWDPNDNHFTDYTPEDEPAGTLVPLQVADV